MNSLISKFNISDVSNFRITSDSKDFTDDIPLGLTFRAFLLAMNPNPSKMIQTFDFKSF